MAAKLKNIMNMQPFEGKFLLFVAEAGKGAQSVIEQGAAKQLLFTRTCPSLRKRPQQTLDLMSDAPPLRIAERGGFPSEDVLVSVSGENLPGLGLVTVRGDDRQRHHSHLSSLARLIDLTHLSPLLFRRQLILTFD